MDSQTMTDTAVGLGLFLDFLADYPKVHSSLPLSEVLHAPTHSQGTWPTSVSYNRVLRMSKGVEFWLVQRWAQHTKGWNLCSRTVHLQILSLHLGPWMKKLSFLLSTWALLTPTGAVAVFHPHLLPWVLSCLVSMT